MIHILGLQHSIFNQYIGEIRDVNIQSDRMRFRKNMERIGEIMAYEISKTLIYEMHDVITPLGVTAIPLLTSQPVVATILRAGLPLHQGFLNYFDKSENAFVSAYRKHHKNGNFDIQIDYLSAPDLTDKVLILCDPMLATGSSMSLVYKTLIKYGRPKHTHIVSVVASSEGVDYVKKNLPENITIWCGAIDNELTVQSYIVPGLGDAGDLAYGTKI